MSTPPSPARSLRCGDRTLSLDRARVMGILNVTPDSFSDGGRHVGTDAALAHARRLVEEGADIVDVGGESTRPGAAAVSVGEELDRVIPVIERIRAELDTIVSIDTSRPDVMRAAASAGAGLINDVRALGVDGALEAAAWSGLPVCLMHMRGTPADMQDAPRYDDVVETVAGFLAERRDASIRAGVSPDALLVDPGFGFGKTLAHNLALFRALERFGQIAPVLAGLSRKGMIGALIARAGASSGKADDGRAPAGEPADRVHGSVAAALLAVRRGAAMVRVHDVAPTVQALAVLEGIEEGEAVTNGVLG